MDILATVSENRFARSLLVSLEFLACLYQLVGAWKLQHPLNMTYIYVHLHNCIFPAKVIQIYKEKTWTIGYIAIFDMWSSSSFDETFMSFFACFFSYSNIEKLELMDRTTFKHGERHSILYFSPSQATFWIAYWDCTTDKPYCRSRINSPSPLH